MKKSQKLTYVDSQKSGVNAPCIFTTSSDYNLLEDGCDLATVTVRPMACTMHIVEPSLNTTDEWTPNPCPTLLIGPTLRAGDLTP